MSFQGTRGIGRPARTFFLAAACLGGRLLQLGPLVGQACHRPGETRTLRR